MIKLFNTLNRQTEEFVPLNDKKVGMYVCGPTVYARAHIGNFRTYLFEDILRRVLLMNDYQVTEVMNITDVEDKIIKESKGKKEDMVELTKRYEEKFWEDLSLLNISKPERITRATEYIEQMVVFIEDLLKKGYAYKAEDGSVYFSIEKFKDYGKLSRLDKGGIKSGARVAQDEYDKENPADFALWKAWGEEDGEIFWETSLGKGRPGWHIECSAMSTAELGDIIDIHTGAVDLIFPHHENEIAQSEAKTGQQFVKYWVHGEHLLVEGQKMAKSLGNVYTLEDLVNKGFSPVDFRYLILTAHYRSRLNFTWEALTGARTTLNKIRGLRCGGGGLSDKVREEVSQRVIEALNDDLDTPRAIAILHEVNDFELWKRFEPVLALDLEKEEEIPGELTDLAREREEARKAGNWDKADELRREIEKSGYKVEDTAGGSVIKQK